MRRKELEDQMQAWLAKGNAIKRAQVPTAEMQMAAFEKKFAPFKMRCAKGPATRVKEQACNKQQK